MWLFKISFSHPQKIFSAQVVLKNMPFPWKFESWIAKSQLAAKHFFSMQRKGQINSGKKINFQWNSKAAFINKNSTVEVSVIAAKRPFHHAFVSSAPQQLNNYGS